MDCFSSLCIILLQVTRESHGYLDNIEEREEGGTPAITESIRAGLVLKIKDVGTAQHSSTKIS